VTDIRERKMSKSHLIPALQMGIKKRLREAKALTPNPTGRSICPSC
jgi:hypothetical protein